MMAGAVALFSQIFHLTDQLLLLSTIGLALARALLELSKSMLRAFGRPLLGEIIRSVIQPLLVVGFVVLIAAFFDGPTVDQTISASIGAVLICALAILSAALITLPSELRGLAIEINLREWAAVSAPIFIYSLAFQLVQLQPTIMLGLLGPDHDVGEFALAAQISQLPILGHAGINVVFSRSIAQYYTANRLKELQKLLVTTNVFSIFIFILIAFWIFIFRDTLYDHWRISFPGAYKLLVILLIGQAVNVMTGSAGYVTIMTGQQQAASWALLGTSVMQGILLLVLIRSGGSTGAAIATVLGIALSNIVLMILAIVKTRLTPSALIYLFARRRFSALV
jgi:Na+-driven multidrug efflux pump